ncbi:hypothetical protein PTSG_08742 [Salpingoeca rosetta]|uniref:Prolyl 4-hydroxylase alpha subunit domain-containing protein n=1 Tax=Salpingoeca rosetta (strain ATCC 50818 / BSB-021) TaxID=946362 RepID=F2UKK0_SALR5|nr:uncharacterized protein PTSG_08742 [Salpingoeca rosetta]EGD77649.1 hypothetical protein PTSG_08742 [Salpingoeca rosetta]|eukprot:XP_004990125.1 hypothetical protein PTSG_08742 [Salpingoeca rosetta]
MTRCAGLWKACCCAALLLLGVLTVAAAQNGAGTAAATGAGAGAGAGGDGGRVGSSFSAQPRSFNVIRLRDAGMKDVNGLWHEMLGLHNGAPQFQRRVNDTKAYELFLHQTEDGSWWNIQEVVKSAETGQVRFGSVVYGKAVTKDSTDPTAIRWESWEQRAGPAPLVDDLRVCQSIAQCDHGDDECLDYYITAHANMEFIHDAMTDDGGILACEDRGDWIRDVSDDEIERFTRLFRTTGIVSIPNFFREDVFVALQEELTRPLHSQFWQASFVDPATSRATTVPRSRANNARIERMIAQQHTRRRQGKYAYSFTRTVSTAPPKYRRFYRHFFGDMASVMESRRMQQLLTRISQRSYELTVLFISRYTSGDFLDRHSDSVETRRIAFTFHLTEDWRLEYGGLLLFLNQYNWDQAERVLVPQRNAFTFFDVSEERRVLPHLVTEVVAGLDRERIAVTGWMQFKGERDKFCFPSSHEWFYDS